MRPFRTFSRPFAGRQRALLAAAFAISLAFPAGALATKDVDLLTDANVVFTGEANADAAGTSVASAGDFNNDGIDDLLVGARLADPPSRANGGIVYVVYGQANQTSVNLAQIEDGDTQASRGMRLIGSLADDDAGDSLDGIGDFNGDGIDDIIIGARGYAVPGDANGGAAYVIYGQAGDPADVDLGQVQQFDGQDARGMTILGPVATASLTGGMGRAVNGVGDINNDGAPDVAVDAVLADINGADSGAAWVIYGSTGTADPPDVNTTLVNDAGIQNARGFRIVGAGAGNQLGSATGVIGDIPFVQDFNDDGFDDLAVSAVSAAAGNGVVYVVYGANSADPADVALATDTTRFMSITGQSGAAGAVTTGNVGSSLAGVPDFNGDSRGDLLVGAPGVDNNGRNDSGSAYVVFSGTGADLPNVDLSTLGSAGFRVDGAAASDALGGVGSSPTGDINGDEAGDLAVSALLADPHGNASGASYLVYATAQTNPANVDTAQLKAGAADPRGLVIDGAAAEDRLGSGVAPVGDVDANGIEDLLIGARSNATGPGRAYITDMNPGSASAAPGGGLSFADRLISAGASAGQQATLTNTDPEFVIRSDVVGFSGPEAADFSLQNNTCASVYLLPGGACTTDVLFDPSASGARNASLDFSNQSSGFQQVALSGTGLNPLASFGPPLSFGQQNVGTVSTTQQATLTNIGDDPLTVSSVALTGTDPGQFLLSNDNCTGQVLAPLSGSCSVDVTFAPTSRGSKSALVSFTDDAFGSPHTLGVDGTGETPALTAEPHEGVDFGLVQLATQSDPQSVAVQNTGPDPVTLSSVTLTGADAAQFQKGTDSCQGQTLTPNEACAVDLRFTPASVGTKQASLRLDSNAIGGPTILPVTGIGQEEVPPPIAGNRGVGAVEEGTVLIKKPTDGEFKPVEAGSAVKIPVNTVIDATNGEIAIVSERDHKTGATRVGRFSQGAFRFFQEDVRKPLTDIILTGGGSCPVTGKSKGKAKGRKVFGNAGGGHRTSGAYGAATVRGTQWLTEDVCGPDGQLLGTRITTVEGKVQVNNFKNKKTKMVTAGRSVLVKP